MSNKFHSSNYGTLFSTKKVLIFFLVLHANVCCGYSLDVHHQGTSNEYSQYIFSWGNSEVLLMSTHNIYFCEEIRKIFT